MKSITTYITEKMIYNKSTASKYKYHPKTKEELQELLKQLIEERGNEGDFNDIDTSEITDMSALFNSRYLTEFNGDISKWNVSNVKNMSGMFYYCKSFNQPLNDWDVSNVKNMKNMFLECEKFNQPLNDWNVSKVTSMWRMFCECKSFNQPLDKWDISNVTYMDNMFNGCESFNQDISKWDVSNVTSAWLIFKDCPIEDNYKPKFKF